MRTAVSRAAPVLFFLTGAGGLIYQTVWMRMLIRVFGITVYATTTVVAVFMAGLAIGAMLGARYTSRAAASAGVSSSAAPSLRAWSVVEIAAGASALVATFAIRALPALYASLAVDVSPSAQVVLRVLLASACLLPPTILMGATLPLLVAAIEPRRPGSVALLYGANTLGAVAGVLVVGFMGIAILGETGTVLAAVALHIAVAACALFDRPGAFPSRTLSTSATSPRSSTASPSSQAATPPRAVLWLAAACAGFVALSCEIAWTRLLVFVVGSSVYGFSSMLGVFLLGIGIGSFASRALVPRHVPAVLTAMGVCAALSLRVFLWIGEAASDARYLYSPLSEPFDVVRFLATSAAVVMPLTIVSGALFPLLVRSLSWRDSAASFGDVSSSTGRLYAINTIGSVVGALVAGFATMGVVGAQGTVFLAALVAFLAATIATASMRQLARPTTAAGAMAAFVALTVIAPTDDVTRAVLDGRLARMGMHVVKHTETVDTTVTVARREGEPPVLLLNGIWTSTKGLVGEAMAHLPLSLQASPQRALVICFGVGSTFTAAARHAPQVDVVELVGEVPRLFPLFAPEAALLLDKPGVRVFIEDGRNFLLRSTDRYATIIIDGSPPLYAAGTVNIYSKEMMQLADAHLLDDGVFMLWVPTLTWRGDVWGITRALTDVFPHTTIWVSPSSGWFLLGSRRTIDTSPAHIDANVARANLVDAPWFSSAWLAEKGAFLDDATLRAGPRDGSPVAPVTDDWPHSEYPLGKLFRGEPMLKHARQLLSEANTEAAAP